MIQGEYFSWRCTGPRRIQSSPSKLHVCTTKCEVFLRAFTLFFLNLITPLAVFIPALKKKEKKSPRSIIFASLFTRLVVILPSADQHVQYNVLHSRSLFGFLRRERETLFSCFSPRFRAFFSLLSGLLMRLV